MKLMIRSYSNLLLSVRRVTQMNAERKTAGIDGQTATTPAERVNLIKEMKEHTLWKAHPARRIYIPIDPNTGLTRDETLKIKTATRLRLTHKNKVPALII